MNKITRALIEVKHPSINIDTLMEVINATPNAEVATEMLCGLYEEPSLPKYGLKNDGRPGGLDLTMTTYDKWRDHVNYTYNRKAKKEGYFDKSIDKSDITPENFDKLKISWRSDAVSHAIETGEWETREDYCSTSEWLRFAKEWSLAHSIVNPAQ
jgi:hypothetical protein